MQKLMLTYNEHSVMLRTTTNGDLCDFLRSFVAFSLTRDKIMATNINATERNTLPVLCNIRISNINIIYIYRYIRIYISVK